MEPVFNVSDGATATHSHALTPAGLTGGFSVQGGCASGLTQLAVKLTLNGLGLPGGQSRAGRRIVILTTVTDLQLDVGNSVN